MTKQEATKIKKVIKEQAGNYTVYFNSKKEELRITVAQYQDDTCEPKTADVLEQRNICKILNVLSDNGMRPKYKKESKKYQGFINCRYIVFE